MGPLRRGLLRGINGHAAAFAYAYLAKGLDSAFAPTQARVARIFRHTDYDSANKRPILWTPPKPE